MFARHVSFLLLGAGLLLLVFLAPVSPAGASGPSGKISGASAPVDLRLVIESSTTTTANLVLEATSHAPATDFELLWRLSPGVTLKEGEQKVTGVMPFETKRTFKITVEKPAGSDVPVVSALVRLLTEHGAISKSTRIYLKTEGDRVRAASEAEVPAINRSRSTKVYPAIPIEAPANDPQFDLAEGPSTVTVYGSWSYSHHIATPTGVNPTGNTRPIRLAYIEIQKQLSPGVWTKVASGHTDLVGFYRLGVPGIDGTKDVLRSYICLKGPLNDKLTVAWPDSANVLKPFCYATGGYGSSYMGWGYVYYLGSWAPLDNDENGGPANIYDTLLYGYDLVTRLAPTSSPLTVRWYYGNAPSCGSCYYPKKNLIDFNGTGDGGDEWDDSVILQEMGHWVMEKYAAFPPNSAGAHGVCNYSGTLPNLAYFEGWATFFSMAARQLSGDWQLQSYGSYYIDTQYGIGGGLAWSRNLESDTEVDSITNAGNWCEWAVAGTLWDVFDSAADGSDHLSRSFGDIFTAFRTKYNRHYPIGINQWWYGWVNTLANRPGGSLGDEQALFYIFGDHSIRYGVGFALAWGTLTDLDSHLWLPPATPYHILYNHPGNYTAYPWSALMNDSASGGPENSWIVAPYKGLYTFGAYRWNAPILEQAARVDIYDADMPSIRQTILEATTGTGQWWNVLTYNGINGAIKVVNKVQTASPSKYDPNPSAPTRPKH